MNSNLTDGQLLPLSVGSPLFPATLTGTAAQPRTGNRLRPASASVRGFFNCSGTRCRFTSPSAHVALKSRKLFALTAEAISNGNYKPYEEAR